MKENLLQDGMLKMNISLEEFKEMFGSRDSIFSMAMYIQYIAEMSPAVESVEEMQRRLLMINDLAQQIAVIEGKRLIFTDLCFEQSKKVFTKNTIIKTKN